MSTPTPRTDRQAVVSLGKTWKASYDEMHEHARTLERELATERARLDSGQILLTVSGERVWHCGLDLRAAIDAAMKEETK